MVAKLTLHEDEAVRTNQFNLADGHARYLPTGYRRDANFVAGLDLMHRTGSLDQLESHFSRCFFDLARQTAPRHALHVPTASLSIEIVANYLRMRNMSVALIEPAFDNLADIIKRHAVRLRSLPEVDLRSGDIRQSVLQSQADAIFLVLPNNPTGFELTKEQFVELAEVCAQTRKLLVLDFSFRFFGANSYHFDQYDVLEQSGCPFIAIEDTGKTWDTLELKNSVMSCDTRTFSDISAIYQDLFISQSPLVLGLLGVLIEQSSPQTIQYIPSRNRVQLRNLVEQTTYLKPLDVRSNISVDWIEIASEWDAYDMKKHLREFGVYVLPGSPFYWNSHVVGRKYFRVALMRDEEFFAGCMTRLQFALQEATSERLS